MQAEDDCKITIHLAGLRIWKSCFDAIRSVTSTTQSSHPIPLVFSHTSVSTAVFDSHRSCIANLKLEVETENIAPQTNYRIIVQSDLFAAAIKMCREENDVAIVYSHISSIPKLVFVETLASGQIFETDLEILDVDVDDPPRMTPAEMLRLPFCIDMELSILRTILECAALPEVSADTIDISVSQSQNSPTEIVNELGVFVNGGEGKLKRRFRFKTIHVDAQDAMQMDIDEPADVDVTGETKRISSLKIATKYLQPFVKVLQPQKIRLRIGNDAPLFLHYSISEDSFLSILVMPRLADEEA